MGKTCSVTLVFLVLLLIAVERGRFLFTLGCQRTELDALTEFKSSLSDPASRLSSWEGGDCCQWKGVRCNNITGYVESLDLRNDFNIFGFENWDQYTSKQLTTNKLDPALLKLRYLSHLDLSGTNFNFSQIPDFIGSMKHLRYLNLHGASFRGVVPHELGNLTNLHVLDISENYMFVDDLHWVSGLRDLQYLDMSLITLPDAHHSIQSLSTLPLVQLRLLGCKLGKTNLFHAFYNSTLLSTIHHLDLSFNSIEGPVPSFFSNMSFLRDLDFSHNKLNGTIPLWFKDMQVLEYLYLERNAFQNVEGGTVLEIIGKLCNLKALDLSDNLLEGEIFNPPQNVSKCTTLGLEALDLSSNSIKSTLAYSLRELRNLRQLRLGSNRLLGKIPAWMGSFPFLEELSLGMNSLEGNIPYSIGGLHSLKSLDLSHNSLNGSVPSSIGRMLSLSSLDLSNNLLNGNIPDSIGQCYTLSFMDLSSNHLEGILSNNHLANLSNLQSLDLSFNPLNLNFISEWVPPFQLDSFSMSSCKINSQLPTWIQTQKQIRSLDLSDNEISGEMPEWFSNINLSKLNLSYNNISGHITPFPSQIESIDLAHNLLSGPLPQGNSASSLCHLSYLTFIDLQNNDISGTIPDCWGNSLVLNVINFSSNKLSGLIPMSIGLHSFLEYLNLNGNYLEGRIPPTISSCTNLVILDLGENKLSGEIPTFDADSHPILQILRLRGNQLGGLIPPQLCFLPELHILDLARNNLTGDIPWCLSYYLGMGFVPSKNVPNAHAPVPGPIPETQVGSPASYFDGENAMEVFKGEKLQYTKSLQFFVNLDLSSNRLEGSIPDQLAYLSGLVGLNLSYNHLTGRIPGKIGEMRSLESLDLSNNNLNGTIPSSVSALPSLSHLNLSYNNLHGQIPTGTQLQTLDDPAIYRNNIGLCGFPLPNKCAGVHGENGEQGHKDDYEGDNHEDVLFYMVVILGFATGFWGMIGTLILKKRWRHSVFQRVDDSIDYFYVQIVVRVNKWRS